ncbi:MAG TPA: ROK family protein [Cyclobacteriaceae bacterium]|nr:ROK family protein [Cyclobacteriaceae bacterium]
MNQSNLWGIDLGGTKIEGAILESASNPKVLFRERVPTEAEQGYQHIVDQLGKMVKLMTDFAGYSPERIGFATPGALDPQLQVMKNCNTTDLNGKPLKKDLEKLIGTGIYMANDANCFALAETKLGVVKEKFPNANVVFGVIMGTGVGGGLVVNGEVINGLHGIGGEWGHNFLDESGGPCYCGKSGCVEKVLAGPALERFYLSKSGAARSLKEIVSMARNNTDKFAGETMTRLVSFFGKALSVIINIVDPDVIVIGGGVGNIDLLYSEGRDAVRENIFNLRLETPIVRPMLGDSAGVFGAAFLTERKSEVVH